MKYIIAILLTGCAYPASVTSARPTPVRACYHSYELDCWACEHHYNDAILLHCEEY